MTIGNDNGLSILQGLIGGLRDGVTNVWLPAAGTGAETSLGTTAGLLLQAGQVFSAAAAANQPAPPYPQLLQNAQDALSQTRPTLSAAADSLTAFTKGTSTWPGQSATNPIVAFDIANGPVWQPPPLPTYAMGGPLPPALLACVNTIYAFVTDANSSLDVINTAPQPGPGHGPDPVPPAADPSAAVSAALVNLGTVLTTASQYCLQTEADINTAARAQFTLLADSLADVNTIATQLVAGTLPADAASLADVLGKLTAVRAVVFPSVTVIAGTDDPKFAYALSTAWLDWAMGVAITADTGTAALPAVLLPVRVETRLAPAATGGITLRVRIFPDDIAVDAHDPNLTADEASAAATLQAAVNAATPGDDSAAASVWAQTAATFGPGRTAYLNLVQLPGPGKPPDPFGAQPTPPVLDRDLWPAPASCTLLPDRWLVVVYGFQNQVVLGAALSNPVRRPLQVGPDLRIAEPASGTLGVETGLEWMVDYKAALEAGMAVTVTLDGMAGQTEALFELEPPSNAPAISRVVVVGLAAPPAAGSSDPTPQTLLADTLLAHRFTDGLEVLAPGTPTNNTDGQPSPYRELDPGFADSYAREVSIPRSWPAPYQVTDDPSRLAAALAIPDTVFTGAGAPRQDALNAQAMAAIAWHATGGVFLPWYGNYPDGLRAWVTAYVTPSGPLPAFRVGPQPYGVLPVVSSLATAPWVSDAGSALGTDVGTIIATWKAVGASALQRDMMSQLEQASKAQSFAAGLAVANDPSVQQHAGKVDWLPDNMGLMMMKPADVMTAMTTTGSALAGFGTFPTQLTFFDTRGANAAVWPMTATSATVAAQQTFLAGLPTTGPVTGTPDPATLLTALANNAWLATFTAKPATPAAVTDPLQQRGLLPAGQVPAPAPDEGTELRAATAHLAAATDVDFDALAAGALDVVSHRIDAWATAVATSALADIRYAATGGTGLAVGCYGVVENLVMAPPLTAAGLADDPTVLFDPVNDGYLMAPSPAQAVTSAVLRSGYLNHAPADPAQRTDGNAPFAVDLSSRRARTAQWILDGMRQGQPLGALLGYRFERRLVRDGQGALVDYFRKIAPLDPAANQDPAVDVTADQAGALAARGTDVADGVTLHTLWLAQQASPSSGTAVNHFTDDATRPAFQEIDDALDAVNDAITATAVHHSIAGDTTAAAATLSSVMHGTVAVDPSGFLRTPRTGTAIIQRILLPVAAATLPTGWTSTPTVQAEPALSSWVAGLLPAPADMVVLSGTFTAGTDPAAPLPALTPVTVAALGLGPLDFLALAQRPTELRQLAVFAALSQTDLPAGAGVAADAPVTGTGPYGDALDIASFLAPALGAARPADARDLTSEPSGAVPGPGVDQADLDIRVTAALAAVQAAITGCAAALPGVPAPGTAPRPPQLPTTAGPATLAAALRAATLLGAPGAVPGAGPDDPDTLAAQVYTAWTALLGRLAAATAAVAPAGATDSVMLAAALSQLAAVFGKQFTAIPKVPALATVAAQTPSGLTGRTPGDDPLGWLVKASRTRAPVAELITAVTGAEASAPGSTALTVTVAQDPPGQPWAGGTLPSGTDPSTLSGTVCLTLVGSGAVAAASGALVLADWTETIPSNTETAAIAYQFTAPAAQAPQVVLLAVNSTPSNASWSWSDLVGSVTLATDLAYCRAAGPNDTLPALGPITDMIRPAMLLSATPPDPPVSAAFTPGYMAFTPEATVRGLSRTDDGSTTLKQGETADFAVIGTALTGVTQDSIGVTGTGPGPALDPQYRLGVAVATYRPSATTPDTDGVVTLVAAPDATPGPRLVTAGYGSSNATITVTPRSQATSCDTQLIHQAITGQTVPVTIDGFGLTGSTADLVAGGSLASIASVTSNDQVVVVTLTIAASTYQPGDQTSNFDAALIATMPINPRPPWHAPRPPQHQAAALGIQVTPPGASPQTFTITVDCLV